MESKPGVTAEEIAEKLRGLKIPEGFADDLEAVRAEEPPSTRWIPSDGG